jgi:transcriptional antiterminator NusG
MKGVVVSEMAVETQQPRQAVQDAPERLAGEKWHVLYVKSRQEKALSDELSAMRIRHYLPLLRKPRFYRRRKRHVELPLFPGYMFLFGVLDDVYSADRTKRVARVIRVADQQQMELDLKNLRLAESNGAVLRSHTYLRRGTKVEVQEGPLRGLQGIVENATRPSKLVLQVQMLARAASLEIDGALVGPIL